MTITRDIIQVDTIALLRSLAADWDYSGEITLDTYLIQNLGSTSLDVVILSTTVQQKYDTIMPFTDLFADIGQREVRDITVGEWIDFVYRSLNGAGQPVMQ